MLGKLYLVPSSMGENTDTTKTVVPHVKSVLNKVSGIISEKPKTTRAFMQLFELDQAIFDYQFAKYDKKTDPQEIVELLKPLQNGEDWALMSEAGCPGIADPGAALIRHAHFLGITVVPCVGPSSIFLALMASGLNGQNFAFHGYIPRDPKGRGRALSDLEKQSRRFKRAEIFMETPYRNNYIIEDALKSLAEDTAFCIASNITLPNEWICTKTIGDWKHTKIPDLNDSPTIFILQGNP